MKVYVTLLILTAIAALVLMALYMNREGATPTAVVSAPGNAMSFQGACDVSGGVALTTDVFVVADDEDNVLRFYDKSHPSLPVNTVDLTGFLQITPDRPEADIEAAARVGQTVYWITSHGRNKDGKPRPNRYRFFATAIRAAGQEVSLEPVGIPYRDLARDLSNITVAGFNLASAIRLDSDLKKKERQRLAPKEQGLNIEGLGAAPDERVLYIGLRNPLVSDKAIVIPLKNASDVTEASARPDFGKPMLWDLDHRGIRSMEYSPYHKAFLIVAGPIHDETGFALYRWSGQAQTAPRRVRSMDAALPRFTPEALIPFDKHPKVLLLSDDGTRRVKVSGPQACLDTQEYDDATHTCPQKYLVAQDRKTFRGILVEF